MFRRIRTPQSAAKGFTLVELIISIAIFGLMTALLVVKYGTFNDSVLLTNLAYDVAATIRTAQTYGLSVRSGDDGCNNPDSKFKCAYGVRFDTANPDEFSIFSLYPNEANIDTFSPTNNLTSQDVPPSYAMKRGALITDVCYGPNSCTADEGKLEIVFLRPNPNAIICFEATCHSSGYAEITITGRDGSTRGVVVRGNGQISVKE